MAAMEMRVEFLAVTEIEVDSETAVAVEEAKWECNREIIRVQHLGALGMAGTRSSAAEFDDSHDRGDRAQFGD